MWNLFDVWVRGWCLAENRSEGAPAGTGLSRCRTATKKSKGQRVQVLSGAGTWAAFVIAGALLLEAGRRRARRGASLADILKVQKCWEA